MYTTTIFSSENGNLTAIIFDGTAVVNAINLSNGPLQLPTMELYAEAFNGWDDADEFDSSEWDGLEPDEVLAYCQEHDEIVAQISIEEVQLFPLRMGSAARHLLGLPELTDL